MFDVVLVNGWGYMCVGDSLWLVCVDEDLCVGMYVEVIVVEGIILCICVV